MAWANCFDAIYFRSLAQAIIFKIYYSTFSSLTEKVNEENLDERAGVRKRVSGEDALSDVKRSIGLDTSGPDVFLQILLL